jgi:hypothetical protein
MVEVPGAVGATLRRHEMVDNSCRRIVSTQGGADR